MIDGKTFEQEFKKIFQDDKLYLPIVKQMANLFRSLEPKVLLSEQSKKVSLQEFKTQMIETHKAFADQMNVLQKAFNEEIKVEQKKSQERKTEDQIKLSEVSKELKKAIDEIDKKILKLKEQVDIDTQKASQINQRDISNINKVMLAARKKYIEITEDIVKEYHLSIEQNQALFDEKKALFESRLTDENHAYSLQKDEIILSQKTETEIHDENYVSIKTNYSKLAISINKKISEITKKYNTAFAKKKAHHQESIQPTELKIQELKDEYQVILNQALNTYTEKFNALNQVFDAQKEKFEIRRDKIVAEGNEAISILNSKLSSYKDSVQKEKHELTKIAREEASVAESGAIIDQINSSLNQKTNQLDAELNKQIIRTHKDVLFKKRESQLRVFELELKHLREINDWRSNKAIIELEKKQEFAKIEMNLKHNLLSFEHALKRMEAKHHYQQDILKLALEYDLATMDSQLMHAQSIQERDLNLLANDALLSIENAKHQEKMIQLNHEKMIADIHLERDIETSFRESNRLVLDTTSQLELEKEKLKRDFIINEQELKAALSDAILNRTTYQLKHALKMDMVHFEAERFQLLAEYKHQMDEIKSLSLLDKAMNHHAITKSRFETQQAITHLKIDRSIKTYKNEIDTLHTMMDALFSLIRYYQNHHRDFVELTQALYELPSHPESFKQFLSAYHKYSQQLLHDSLNHITAFESYNRHYYIQKANDQSGIHFSTKQEETLHYYQQEKFKIEDNIRQIDERIVLLEGDFIKLRNDIDHQQLFINQLSKIDKSLIKKSEHSENQILIQNHQKSMMRLTKEMKLKEKELNQAHIEREKYLKENEQVDNSQNVYMDQIEKENQNKSALILSFVHLHQKNTKNLISKLMNIEHAVSHFTTQLKNQVYVSNSFMTNEIKRLKKIFTKFDQSLLVIQHHWMKDIMHFYHSNISQQMILLKHLNRSVALMQEEQNQKVKSIHHAHQSKWKHTKLYYKNQKLEIKNDMKKQLDFEQSSYLKQQQEQQQLIRSIENKISQNNERQKSEINLINENQVSVAIHYKETHEQTHKNKTDHHQKYVDTLFSQVQSSTKNQLNLYHSLELKNEALLIRQSNEHTKITHKLKTQFELYNASKIKSSQTLKEKETLYEKTVKESYQNRELVFAKIKLETKKETQSIIKQQNLVFKGEAILLKKAHSSKMKMLHLN